VKKAKNLIIFGQYADGCVDVADDSKDVLVHVPRDVAEAVCAWVDKQANEHDEALAEAAELYQENLRLREAISAAVAASDRLGGKQRFIEDLRAVLTEKAK